MNSYKSKNITTDCDTNSTDSLSVSEYDAIQKECICYEDIRAVSIEALKIVQRHRGWISDDSMKLIAKVLGISVTDLEGVATFYNQIFRQPVGRHIIRYCDSIVCYMFECEKIKNILMNVLNITEIGKTTIDNRFTLLPTCCIGKCDKAPVIMIDNDEYHNIVPEKIIKLLEYYL